jgi:hypothetical protein
MNKYNLLIIVLLFYSSCNAPIENFEQERIKITTMDSISTTIDSIYKHYFSAKPISEEINLPQYLDCPSFARSNSFEKTIIQSTNLLVEGGNFNHFEINDSLKLSYKKATNPPKNISSVIVGDKEFLLTDYFPNFNFQDPANLLLLSAPVQLYEQSDLQIFVFELSTPWASISVADFYYLMPVFVKGEFLYVAELKNAGRLCLGDFNFDGRLNCFQSNCWEPKLSIDTSFLLSFNLSGLEKTAEYILTIPSYQQEKNKCKNSSFVADSILQERSVLGQQTKN